MAIAYDTTSNATGTSGITWSHTCSGSNRILFVALGVTSGVSHTVTYAGVSMTQVLNPTVGAVGFYYLINPASGANNIVVTGSGGTMQACATSYNGVAQSGNPEASTLGDTGGGANTITNGTTTVTDNAWVVGLAGQFTGSAVISAGTGSTQRVSINGGGVPVALYDNGGPKTPAGSVSMQINSTVVARFFFYTYAIKPAADTNANFLTFF